MKKTIILAGLIAIGATASFAQSTNLHTNALPGTYQGRLQRLNPEEERQKLQNMTQEERKAYLEKQAELRKQGVAQGRARQEDFLKNLGINPEEFRTNSPAVNRAKLQEASAKKLEELSKKKESGTTLTPEEQGLFMRLERMKNASARPVRAVQPPVSPKPAAAAPATEAK